MPRNVADFANIIIGNSSRSFFQRTVLYKMPREVAYFTYIMVRDYWCGF
jgi:hypothetical protein